MSIFVHFREMFRRCCLAPLAGGLMLGLLLTSPVSATTLEGLGLDSSGSGIQSGGVPVRLIGVHFPSDARLCSHAVQGCLELAMERLSDLAESEKAVRCDVVGVSSAGTHLSQCHVGEQDVGGWLVENGLALADRQISRRYVRQERAARSARRGMWAEIGAGFDSLTFLPTDG